MSGLMNSYFYGKAGKADYTPDQLPDNRVALFFEMLRIRFSGLLGMNLLCILISLPALAWSYLTVQALNLSLTTASEGVAETASVLNGTVLIFFMLLIPCLMIIGIFQPGIVYVLRNWSRDQHSFAMSDFKDAVKANWKTGLLQGLINGFSLLLTYIGYSYYGAMVAINGMFWLIPQVLIVLFCCVWWMANMLITPMMVTYDMNFRTLVRNAIIMVVARLPWSVLFWAGSVLLPLVLLLYVPYGILIALVLYGLIGFALTYFVYVSYANSCFDRFLNPRIEGAKVNMGLRDPSLAEEDEEVTEEDIKNL